MKRSSMKSTKLNMRHAFVLLVLAMGFAVAEGAADTSCESPGMTCTVPLENRAAPAGGLMDLDGDAVEISRFEGERGVLLYFWATWCAKCRAATPRLEEIRRECNEDRLEVLAVNVGQGDSLKRVKRYSGANATPGRVLYDEGARVTRQFGATGVPYYVLIDRQGGVAYRGNTPPENTCGYLE